MLIMDILVHSNRRRSDAYCQGQRSECVGGWSRLFSLLRHSSYGSIQMPKSSIVWPHSNNTIVPSGSDCAAATVFACVCTLLSVCLCSVLMALCVSIIIWTCVCLCGIVCLHPSSMRLHFSKRGLFLCWWQQCKQSLKCSRANAAWTWPCFLALLPVK